MKDINTLNLNELEVIYIIQGMNNNLSKLNLSKYFSFCNINNNITFNNKNITLEKIISVFVSHQILSFRIIDTINGYSSEGYSSQGAHMVVDILFQEKIIYSENNINSQANVLNLEFFHSAMIPLPNDIDGISIYKLLNINRLKPLVHVYGTSNIPLDDYSLYNTIYSLVEVQYLPTYQLCYTTFDHINISKIFTSFKDGSNCTLRESFKFSKIHALKWSPNGDMIAYCKVVNHCKILYMSNFKNSFKFNKEIVLAKNIAEFYWVDNHSIIYTSSLDNQSNIYSLNIKNNTLTKLTFNKPDTICQKPICYLNENHPNKKIMFIRDNGNSKLLYEMDIKGLQLSIIYNTKNIYDYTLSHDNSYIACLVNDVFENIKNEETIVTQDFFNKESNFQLIILDLFTKKEISVAIPISYLKISKVIHKPFDSKFIFIVSFQHKDDIYYFDYISNSLFNLTENEDDSFISDMAMNNMGDTLYYASNELGFYNIFTYDFNNQEKRHIISTNSLDVKLDYRPSL